MDHIQKTGRNDPCICGSGRKYKNCCLDDVKKVYLQKEQELQIDYGGYEEKEPSPYDGDMPEE